MMSLDSESLNLPISGSVFPEVAFLWRDSSSMYCQRWPTTSGFTLSSLLAAGGRICPLFQNLHYSLQRSLWPCLCPGVLGLTG